MSGRTSGKEEQQSPQRCPKCGATANLTVSVTVVADGSTIFGGRVVWDTATKCGACGFIGKVADFEPTDSYSQENEEEWEKIARGDYDLRCQPRGDPSRMKPKSNESLTSFEELTSRRLRPGPENEERRWKRRHRQRTASISKESGAGRPVFGMRSGAGGRPEWLKKKKWLKRNLW
jgi:hypothetical protein